MSKEHLDALSDKIKYRIALEVIHKKMSIVDILEILDIKILKKYKTLGIDRFKDYKKKQISYSKAKTFISKTRTILT